MSTAQRGYLSLVFGFAAIVSSIALVRAGAYGLTLFLLVPIFVGGLAAWWLRPETAWRAALTGACSAAVGGAVFLGLGMEGAICIVMALPLTTVSGKPKLLPSILNCTVPVAALGEILAVKLTESP